MKIDQTAYDEALIQLTEDWVSESTIVGLLVEEGDGAALDSDFRILRAMTTGIIVDLLMNGFAVPTKYGEPWGTDASESVARFVQEWYQLPLPHTSGFDIVNLEATDLGRAQGVKLAEGRGWTWAGDGEPGVGPGRWV